MNATETTGKTIEQAEWHTLGAFRGCDAHAHQHGINYEAVLESWGPAAVQAALAAADKAGMRCTLDDREDSDHRHCYAVLDICNVDGDIVADRCIPTREVFDWWTTTIELRVNSSDCGVDTPEAHAATGAARGEA